jgi:hypothetical protein
MLEHVATYLAVEAVPLRLKLADALVEVLQLLEKQS